MLRATGRLALVLGMLLVASTVPSQAQYYGTNFVPYGSVNFGGMDFGATNFGSVGFGATNFGSVNFGATNFGSVNFGSTNLYPAAGYGYDPGYSGYGGVPGYGVGPSKYNVDTADATPAAAANSRIGQRSLETVLANNPEAATNGARYNIRSARPRGATAGGTRLIDMTSRDGRVLWPSVSPTAGDLAAKRAAADSAVRIAIERFRATGSASVEQIGAALSGVVAYANPALDYLRQEDPGQVFAFRDFVVNLDRALRTLAGKAEIDAPSLNPVSAPKN